MNSLNTQAAAADNQAMVANPKGAIEVNNLTVDFALNNALIGRKYMRAVNDVSFTIPAGEALAIVGESGSGKSTCARALCGITKPSSGSIRINGETIIERTSKGKLAKLDQMQVAKIVQMIFQDPFSSLNSVHTIAHQVKRPLAIHHPHLSKNELQAHMLLALEKVGLTPVEQTAQKYPHELSGGQRQRVAIARALAVGAPFILADEPISMLDVSIRLGILNLMADMKEDGIGFLYITHDIATARYFADNTAVMYVGHMVEWGDSDKVTQTPQHPYTQLLLSAVPEARQHANLDVPAKKGEIPLWTPQQQGCPFVGRCLKVTEECYKVMPVKRQIAPNHYVRCHHVV